MSGAPTRAAAAPQRVVIIGGGMGALTAAYYLSDPVQNGRYEVRLYTMGWRLGGKGASGRNAAVYDRIEEHGLHIWFGCYHNALALMRDCYAEMARPTGAPLATVKDAFKAQDDLVLMERIGSSWRQWPVHFFDFPVHGDDVPTVLGFLKRLIAWIRGKAEVHRLMAGHTLGHVMDEFALDQGALEPLRPALGEPAAARAMSPLHLLRRIHDHVESLSDDHHAVQPQHLGWIPAALGLVARGLWLVLRHRLPDGDDERRLWILVYLGITCARGMIEDDLYQLGFGKVEGEEFRTWLERHSSMRGVAGGLSDRLAFQSPNLQAFYDAAFAYLGGNTATPNVSATVALRCMLRILLDYRGAFVYEMQAGMGDTVFTPLYEILQKRGVEIHFFHRLSDLKLDASGRAIQRLEISRQVRLAHPPYQPLVDVKGLPCWPSVPDYAQIVDGEELKSSGANLEHVDSGWADTGGSFCLEKGRDFDWVVLGLSYKVLPAVTGELQQASAAWRKMTQGLQAVATQAWQAWFVPDRAQLGMAGPPAIVGAYVEPWSSLTDFSHLIPRESWPPGAVRFLAYDCGVMEMTPGDGDEAVFGRFRDFMSEDAAPLWPDATDPSHPAGLDWQVLWAPSGVDGPARLQHQYWRANTDPTEQYVLSCAGTAGARLGAKPADFDNLVIAGEWTDTGLNISSIETATMSGMQASRAISGHPETIIGERDL